MKRFILFGIFSISFVSCAEKNNNNIIIKSEHEGSTINHFSKADSGRLPAGDYLYCDDLAFFGDSILYKTIKELDKKKYIYSQTFDHLTQKAVLYFQKKDTCILHYETYNETTNKKRTILIKIPYIKRSELGSDFGEDENGNVFAIKSYLYEKGDFWIEVNVDVDSQYLFIRTANNGTSDKQKLFCDDLPGDTKGNLINVTNKK